MVLGLRITYIVFSVCVTIATGTVAVVYDTSIANSVWNPLLFLSFVIASIILMLMYSLEYESFPSSQLGMLKILLLPILLSTIHILWFGERLVDSLFTLTIQHFLISMWLALKLVWQDGIHKNKVLLSCVVISIAPVSWLIFRLLPNFL